MSTAGLTRPFLSVHTLGVIAPLSATLSASLNASSAVCTPLSNAITLTKIVSPSLVIARTLQVTKRVPFCPVRSCASPYRRPLTSPSIILLLPCCRFRTRCAAHIIPRDLIRRRLRRARRLEDIAQPRCRHAHPRRQLPILRIQHGHRHRRRREIRENDLKTPACQFIRHAIARHLD